MKNKQRGFIPLIAIIVLGVSVITGGIITAVKIHDNKKEEVVVNNEPIVQESKTELTLEPEKIEVKDTNLAKKKVITESQDSKNTEEKTALSISPSVKIIDDFLLNQTPENLKEFCNKAKTFNGTGKLIEVLNSDRTDYIKRPTTLYEQIKICNNSKYDNYIWAQYSQKYLMTLSDSDNDNIRKDKINFNNRIKNLNAGTLVGYINYENLNMTPDQILNNKLKQKVYPGEESAFQSEYEFILTQISISLVIPEIELKTIKRDLERTQ